MTDLEKHQVENLSKQIINSYSDEQLEYLYNLLHVELREIDENTEQTND